DGRYWRLTPSQCLRISVIIRAKGRTMADTRVQLEVEDWVRREWMKKLFAMRFSRERVRLSCGGYFDADAVSENFKIVAAISTSGARTSGGKNAVGKMLKIRSDMYFLLLADAERR